MFRHISLALAVSSLVAASSLRVLGQVTVTPNPYGSPTTNPFPPGSPPGDLKPGESADATANVTLDAGDNGVTLVQNGDGTFSITKITATASGSTTIRQPANADDDLKNHELGHDMLFKNEYDKNTKRKAEAALGELLGKKFASQADAEKAFNDALAKATNAIKQQMQTLTDKYDKLTHHGDGTGETTDKGKADALKERDNAKPAGQNPQTPNNKGPKGQSNNFHSSLDPGTDTIHFQTATITNPAAPSDPINTRGQLVIQPLIRIGLQSNGTTLLTDGHIQIVDGPTGNLLLDGFLFEAAIMPSSLPGYSQMIQSYLDIPPDLANGISNSINSPLLAQMDAAAAAGTPFDFWFFTNGSLTSPEGAAGDMVIGAAVPEPATILAVLPLAVLVRWPLRRR